MIEKVLQCLPQLQCKQCGYEGCQPYAKAIVEGKASIDRCLPGGHETLIGLAQIYEKDPAEYSRDLQQRAQIQVRAAIDSSACIGCRKCIEACPQDAIIGAQGYNHSVLNIACHGCGLCVPACPMDCISLSEVQLPVNRQIMAPIHQERYEVSQERLKEQAEQERRAHVKKCYGETLLLTKKNRLKYMLEARERVREKKKNETNNRT